MATRTSASIAYLQDSDLYLTEKPYMSHIPFTIDGVKTWTNLGHVEHSVNLIDVRNCEEDYSLDKNGFAFIRYDPIQRPSDEIHGPNDPYVCEMAAWLKKSMGARYVFVYDCNVSITFEIRYG